MKKLLTFTLALILLLNLTLITDSTVYAKGKRFHDLKTTDWFYETVDILTSQGLISGYPDGSFKPNNTISVAEFITLVVRIKDKGISNGNPWYMPYVNRAKELGLVVDGEYDTYERNITRGEMARIIYRALSKEDQVSSDKDLEYKGQIKDFNQISSTFKTYILKSYATGIMAGYPDGTFKPQNDATRAEAATMIRRLIDKNFRQIPKLQQKHEKLIVNGKNLTVTNKEVVNLYYKILDICKNSSFYVETKISQDNDVTEIFLLPNKNSKLYQSYATISFYYNPQNELRKKYPYFVSVPQLTLGDTKKVLEEVLKLFYPSNYKKIYNDMISIYGNVKDTGLYKEGSYDGRKYKIYNGGYTGVDVEIGKLQN